MKTKILKLTDAKIKKIKKFHEISLPLKKEISEADFSLSKESFQKIFIALSVLSSQQWGTRIEKVFLNKLGLQKVRERGRGDGKDEEENYFEIKCSIITTTNESLNLVQIRNWEDINGYYVAVLDLLDDGKVYKFYLSKSDMEKEIKLLGSSAHGDRETASKNTHQEKRISVNFITKNIHFERWLKKYSSEKRIDDIL